MVYLLANDALGVSRESSGEGLPQVYLTAFEAIEKDEGQELVVMLDRDNIAGTLHVSFMTEWGIDRARSKGAHLV